MGRFYILAAFTLVLFCSNSAADPLPPSPVSIMGQELLPLEHFASQGPQMPTFPKQLVIVTTAKVVQQSTMFAQYLHWRIYGGWNVIVGIESDWDKPTTDDGDDKPARIRAWLKEIYATHGGGYLLIIGTYDVPMRETKPLPKPIQYELLSVDQWDLDHLPTDQYYADVESNWDCNGNHVFGEYPYDQGEGCADWGPEFLVGRIPYYFEISEVDDYLEATLDYEQYDDKIYRDRSIFAAAFGSLFGLNNLHNDNQHYSRTFDYAHIMNRISKDVQMATQTEITRFYEEKGLATSGLAHELPLNNSVIINEWKEGAGMISWAAHGTASSANHMIWSNDEPTIGLASQSEVSITPFISSTDSNKLISAPLGIVHMMACYNGYYEDFESLAISLLGKGAVASIAPSRSAVSIEGDRDWQPDPALADSATASYYFNTLVQSGYTIGEALAYTKWGLAGNGWNEHYETDFSYDDDHNAYGWFTKFSYNIIGDPTISLERCETDLDCDDTLPCNGGEICKEGYCIHTNPVFCEENDCTTNFCDNETGLCTISEIKPDGTPCSETTGMAGTGDDPQCSASVCDQGQCIIGRAEDGTFCSDGEFCTGNDACVEGRCKGLPKPDGTECEDRAFCTVNDICVQGFCYEGEPRECPEEMGFITSCDEDKNRCIYEQIESVEKIREDRGCSCSEIGISKSDDKVGILKLLTTIFF